MPTVKRPMEGLHNLIAQEIGLRIVRGDLLPGEVLPNENILGAQFGVSRTALREAIKVLSVRGLVEVRRKTGTRVCATRHWHVLDPEVLSWQFSGPGIQDLLTDLLELRLLIEPAAARLAATRSTSDDRIEIRQALEKMENTLGSSESAIESDLQFHLAILEATHNSFLRPFGALVQTALRASFRLTSANEAAYKRSLGRHRAVMEAIELHKPDLAEETMRLVLGQMQVDIKKAVQQQHQNARPSVGRKPLTRKPVTKNQ
jgi:DNA-binding FadR family transcriptional regulator